MADDSPDSAGDMSQEDIDAALAAGAGQTEGSSAPTGDPAPPAADPPNDAASPSPEPVTEPAADAAAAAGGEPAGDLSQDDIDAALAAASDETTTPDTPAAAPAPDAPADDAAQAAEPSSDSEVFSQADIDAALAAAGDTSMDPAPAADLSTTTEDGNPKLDSQGRPFDEAAAMMEAAIAEERAAAEAAKAAAASAPPPTPQELPPPPSGAVPLDLPDFTAGASSNDDTQGISLLNDVQLDVKIELGRSQMLIEDVLKLGNGSVVELDKLAGDPVDVLVNDRLVARGEVLILNDNFCVRISEILVGAQLAGASA